MKLLICENSNPLALESSYRRYIPESVELSGFQEQLTAATTLSGKILNRIARPILVDRLNRALVKKASHFRPAVVWVFKGMQLYPRTLRTLRSKSIVLVNYNPDHPFDFCSAGTGNANVSRSARLFDIYFTYSKVICERLIQNGCNGRVLPFGHDVCDATFDKIADEPEVPGVGFVGAADRERATIVEQIATAGIPVDVYGSGWDRLLKNSRSIHVHPEVRGESLLRAFRRNAVHINLLRPHNVGSHNMRTFEVPACGGIPVMPRTDDHVEIFSGFEERLLFNDMEDLVVKLKSILNLTVEDRALLRMQLRVLVAGAHYANRCAFAIKQIEEVIPEQKMARFYPEK